MKNGHIITGVIAAMAFLVSGNAISQETLQCGSKLWVDQNFTSNLEIQLLQDGSVIPPGTPLTSNTSYTLRVRATSGTCNQGVINGCSASTPVAFNIEDVAIGFTIDGRRIPPLSAGFMHVLAVSGLHVGIIF